MCEISIVGCLRVGGAKLAGGQKTINFVGPKLAGGSKYDKVLGVRTCVGRGCETRYSAGVLIGKFM